MCLDFGYVFRQAGDLQKECNLTNLLPQIYSSDFNTFTLKSPKNVLGQKSTTPINICFPRFCRFLGVSLCL